MECGKETSLGLSADSMWHGSHVRIRCGPQGCDSPECRRVGSERFSDLDELPVVGICSWSQATALQCWVSLDSFTVWDLMGPFCEGLCVYSCPAPLDCELGEGSLPL